MQLRLFPNAAGVAIFMIAVIATAAPLSVTVATPAAPSAAGFKMGTPRAPNGEMLTIDSRSLLLNGRRWTPVMGEFHYTRYPATEWRDELRKMKAGGIDIVATYVFWIHHEEIEGRWNWTGDHDLRRFVQVAGEEDLKVIVRCGPWCHGEVRNGGVPDWAIAKGWKVRTDDPPYLEHVRVIYDQIAAQLRGLLWKDGGPVIGIQLENEYDGFAEHLLQLKRIAISAGLDVPIYTRTGWPEMKSAMPFGEIVPLYGAYAEGFWDRETTSMPGNYWSVFHFSTLRTDINIANEALGRRDVRDPPDASHYPYLTCEIGGGMMNSYHRRILIDPRDIEATTLVKLGSGSNSPGYYMYHGGTNPESPLGTGLQELQSTPMTNWNDLPLKNYDFQAPLGQFGQIRPHYYLLRRLHLFLHSFGARLAEMDTFLPDVRPAGRLDTTTLRWAVRSEGQAGFVFVNNYERSQSLAAKSDVQFSIKLSDGRIIVFPERPVTVPAGSCFVWPFNLDLGRGVVLAWATAQPLAVVEKDNVRTVYFAETPGVEGVFALPDGAPQKFVLGQVAYKTMTGAGGEVRLVLLRHDESLAFAIDPATGMESFDAPSTPLEPQALKSEQIAAPGPARAIGVGNISQPVAVAPLDADFQHAAVWRIKLPDGFDASAQEVLLRLRYRGDVLRVTIGGRLVTDDFYNGRAVEIGLRRFANDLRTGEIIVTILPLGQDAITGPAPLIYLPDAARPDFTGQSSVASLDRVELIIR